MSDQIPYNDPNALYEYFRSGGAAGVARGAGQPSWSPPPGPPPARPSGWDWPKGFRRRKGWIAWLSQIGWVIGPTLFVNGFLQDGQAVWLVVGPVAFLSIVWIEFESRCENRALVMKVFAGMMAVLAAWQAADMYRDHRDREQREYEERSTERMRKYYTVRSGAEILKEWEDRQR